MIFLIVFCLGINYVTCQRQMIDLGHGYDERAIEFPGGLPFRYKNQFAGEDKAGIWYSANDFETAEHCGTHIDAPIHFNPRGRSLEQIPLERLITKAILVNASDETAGNSQFKLQPNKLVEWEKRNGEIEDNTVLFVSFGWAHKYPNRTEYLGPKNDDLRFPGISKDAAEWIVNSNKIVGVGVDTPSADQGSNTDAHIALNGNGIYILENVNLNTVLPPRFDIIVMPIKLVNGTGGPTRIIALL